MPPFEMFALAARFPPRYPPRPLKPPLPRKCVLPPPLPPLPPRGVLAWVGATVVPDEVAADWTIASEVVAVTPGFVDVATVSDFAVFKVCSMLVWGAFVSTMLASPAWVTFGELATLVLALGVDEFPFVWEDCCDALRYGLRFSSTVTLPFAILTGLAAIAFLNASVSVKSR